MLYMNHGDNSLLSFSNSTQNPYPEKICKENIRSFMSVMSRCVRIEHSMNELNKIIDCIEQSVWNNRVQNAMRCNAMPCHVT